MAKIADRDQTSTAALFKFANGSTLTCEYDLLSDEMKRTVGIWGINHKVGDGFSQAKSVDEAQEMAEAVWCGLIDGEWTVRVTGGILAECLSRATGWPIEDCRAKVKALDDKAKKKLEKAPEILTAKAAILAERAKDSRTDFGAMFSA
jgi:hypothetical protein